MRRRALTLVLALGALASACGARSGLGGLDPQPRDDDGGLTPSDADMDADASLDGGVPPRDAAPDAHTPPPLDGGAPVPVDPGPRRQVVSAGWRHTCALDAEHRVQCWGHNYSGQLGDGTHFDRDRPTPVLGLPDDPMIEISAGMQHSCARSLRGEIYCWGANLLGQLGHGGPSTAPSTRAVRVAGISGALGVSAAGQHTCALLGDGTARCWGHGSFGQLGNGERTISFAPVHVVGLDRVVQIDAGWRHTCALRDDGSVWCWGYNYEGQLGVSIGESAVPLRVEGATGAQQISAGTVHTCALSASGQVHCWGGSAFGVAIGHAVQVSAGERSETCAALETGEVRCVVPDDPTCAGGSCVRVRGLGAARVSSGFEHGCATVSAGIVCWGSDALGQLGDGPGIATAQPVFVVGP